MLKPALSHSYLVGAVSRCFITILLFFVLLVGLHQLGVKPVIAQGPQGGHTIYLPFIMKSGVSTPAGPYAQILNRVQQMCAATGLNQVCYANGQVSLQAKSGTVAFSQPGAIADLAKVQSLSLTSSGADSQQWGIAWLRLRVNASNPNQDVTILAFGNVQINNITLFTDPASLADEATLPSLHFTSSPIAGATGLGNSGLIVTNPTEEEVLSLTLNGAAISLGSIALVQAQPGSNTMTVAMATGSSVTQVNDASSAATQGQQVTVPLDQNGIASGSPQAAVPADTETEEIEPLVPTKEVLGQRNLTRLNRAIDRCIQGQAAYVYNVLYWIHLIETSDIKPYINAAQLAQAYKRAPNCLTFDVDFDSKVTTLATKLEKSSHLHGGVSLEFLADGSFIGLNQNLNLEYLSYTYNAPLGCITTQTTPGELETAGASLKIAGNKVRISVTLRVAKQPTDQATINCPPAPPISIDQNHWVTVFYHMHDDLWQKPDPSFRFSNWKYTGGEHFGEAIYDRTSTEQEFTFDTTTYLILIHTPVH
ncbi:MAG: hypothetical protein U0401_32210 [Anaerolineae bacterium]